MIRGEGSDASKKAFRALVSGDASEIVRLPIASGSMADAILPGDMLSIRPVSWRRVHTGDVIVFLRDGLLTAHRLVFVFKCRSFSLFVEMGDANRGASPLNRKAIVGLVVSLERSGRPVPFARGPASRTAASRMLMKFLVFGFCREITRRIVGLHGRV